MKYILSLCICLFTSAIHASPVDVIFSGDSIYSQPMKLNLIHQESGKYDLSMTIYEYNEETGLTERTTELVSDLDCAIDELRSLRCETITADGEEVSFYTQNPQEMNRFMLILEANGDPFILGLSLVWETR